MFFIETSARQRFVMSTWLFNVFIAGVLREMKLRVLEKGQSLVKED